MRSAWNAANRSLNVLQSVPEIAHLYRDINIIRGAEDLANAPILDRNVYLKAIWHIYEYHFPQGPHHVFLTSGTIGAPKIGFHPAHQYIPDITRHWDPLPTGRPLLIDLAAAGKGCGSSHFLRELSHAKGFTTLNIGGIDSTAEMAAIWSNLIRTSGATAIGGTPTTLASVASYFRDHHECITSVQCIIWMAEPLKEYHEQLIRSAFPNARLWSVYGSIETWVLAYQTPDMPRDEYYVFPHQHIEVGKEGILATSLHDDTINPILRYALHDSVDILSTTEMGGVRHLRLKGRSDDKVLIASFIISPNLVTSIVNSMNGVVDSQLILRRERGAITGIELRVRLNSNSTLTRADVLDRLMNAGREHLILADLLVLNSEDPFVVNERTGKSPSRMFIDV